MFKNYTSRDRMLTRKITKVIGYVERRIVQLVIRRKRVKSNRCIGSSTGSDVDRWKQLRFIRPIFILLVIRTDQIIGKLATKI